MPPLKSVREPLNLALGGKRPEPVSVDWFVRSSEWEPSWAAGVACCSVEAASPAGDAEICLSLYAPTIRSYTVKTVLVINVHWVHPTIPQTFSYLTFQLVMSLPVHLQIYLPTQWFTRPLQRIVTEFQEENVSMTSPSLPLGYFSFSSSESFFRFLCWRPLPALALFPPLLVRTWLRKWGWRVAGDANQRYKLSDMWCFSWSDWVKTWTECL